MTRGGQVYYVYNRVNNIAEVTAELQRLLPDAKVAFAHGQMKERELEEIMMGFIPEQGNAVHYGRQPVEKYFFDVRFCICLLNNNLKIVLLHLKGGASP